MPWGYQALGDEAYLQAAKRAAEFVWTRLRDSKGNLLRRFRDDHLSGPGFMDDYAFYTFGLIELYQAGLDPLHLERALKLQDQALARFWDELHGGFYFSPHDGENLIFRERDLYDGALPSANSVAALNLLRLARLTGRSDLESKAWRLLGAFSQQISQQPMAYTQMLIALDYALSPGSEVVLAGGEDAPGFQRMLDRLQKPFTPLQGVAGRQRLRWGRQAGPNGALCQGHASHRRQGGRLRVQRKLMPKPRHRSGAAGGSGRLKRVCGLDRGAGFG